MRDPDEPALVADRGDRLDGGQVTRDRPQEECPDEVAVGRPDLRPDDHGQPVGGGVTRAQRPVDAVMVGDDEVGQAALGGGTCHLHRIRQRIERRRGMAVEIDEGARARRPRGVDLPARDHP